MGVADLQLFSQFLLGVLEGVAFVLGIVAVQ